MTQHSEISSYSKDASSQMDLGSTWRMEHPDKLRKESLESLPNEVGSLSRLLLPDRSR